MGLWDTITGGIGKVADFVGDAIDTVGGWLGGSSDRDHDRSDRGGRYREDRSYSGSNTVTNLDPDKVKVAELENERIELMKNAQKELIEVNGRMEAALIEARAHGFTIMAQSMMTLLREINTFGEERYALLENGSRQHIAEVEKLYGDLAGDMRNNNFMTQKMPELIGILRQFESPEEKAVFQAGIEREMATHFDFVAQQLKMLGERQHTVVQSVIAGKERLQQHIDEVVAQRIARIEHNLQQAALPNADFGNMPALNAPQANIPAALPDQTANREIKVLDAPE